MCIRDSFSGEAATRRSAFGSILYSFIASIVSKRRSGRMQMHSLPPNFSSFDAAFVKMCIRDRVCKDIGPRPSGEENERKAQDYFADSMSKVADSVVKEKFELHPKAVSYTHLPIAAAISYAESVFHIAKQCFTHPQGWI